MGEERKNIDETWKEKTNQEKETLGKDKKFTPPEADFKFFITSLALQASIALGVMSNPITNKAEEDLSQAKFLIDTLGVLKEKTKDNLSQEEQSFLENVLYELQVQYLEKTKEKK